MEYTIEDASNYNDTENYSIKVVIVGDSGVGKTNLLSRFVTNEFCPDSKATVGVELFSKTYKINEEYTKIQLWDTAGQERYKSITAAYYKGAKGAMIVYDITRPETLNSVDQWFNEIREFGERGVNIIMVGNKADLIQLRTVDTLKGIEKGKVLGIPFMETSAKDSSNVDEAFKTLIREIYSSAMKSIKSSGKNREGISGKSEINKGMGVNLRNVTPVDKKKGCC